MVSTGEIGLIMKVLQEALLHDCIMSAQYYYRNFHED
jgi:hypothetical protein